MTEESKNARPEASPKGERIAKVLARAGVGSRRDVERLIEAGRISLGGRVLDTPATLVASLEGITVDGEPVESGDATRVWRLHKARGTLTTHRDPEGRPTVFERLPGHLGRVVSVGRLDMNTEGLLLLTNDGALARWMELPEHGHLRRYRVRVHGRVSEVALDRLKDGATIDGVHYGEIDAALERVQGTNAWLTVGIREGKNREVRRIMEHLGLTVNRLIRTHYGPFSLSNLRLGEVLEVDTKRLHADLSAFFKTDGGSVAAESKSLNPKKWAKAKPKKKVRPGASRRRKNGADQDNFAGSRSARPGRPGDRQKDRS